MSEPLADKPLYNIASLVATVDEWAKRHRIKRDAANDVGIALERVCNFYEARLTAAAAEHATALARVAELEAGIKAMYKIDQVQDARMDTYALGFNHGYDWASQQLDAKDAEHAAALARIAELEQDVSERDALLDHRLERETEMERNLKARIAELTAALAFVREQRSTPQVQPELREKLAEYAHEAWSGWMIYLFEKCSPSVRPTFTGDVTMPAWAVNRWQRQMNTPYADLPEEEKQSDREEADKMLAIVGTPQVQQGGRWMPVEDGEYPMVENAEKDGDFLYITGNTDPDVYTWIERPVETIMLDLGMTVCRWQEGDEGDGE